MDEEYVRALWDRTYDSRSADSRLDFVEFKSCHCNFEIITTATESEDGYIITHNQIDYHTLDQRNHSSRIRCRYCKWTRIVVPKQDGYDIMNRISVTYNIQGIML